MSSRSSHTPWPPEYTCIVRSSPSPDGTASVDSGSRKACSMRWVWNTSCTVWALAASSAVDVAAGVHAARQHVVVGAPHGQLGAGLDRRQRVGHRRQHVVADLDQLGRRPRLLARLGDDDGQHVAGVRRAPADRDHDRPVLVDDPDPQLARDVGRREHADDAGGGRRRRRVDRRDVGAGVGGEVQRGVEHARHADVVDVAAVAERQLGRLVLGARRADRAARARAGTTCPWPRPRWRRGS